MSLYIKPVDNTLTPEELQIKRDKEIKELFTSIGVHKLDKKSWKARKEVKAPNIYIMGTRDDAWLTVGVKKLHPLKKAIEEAGITTTSVMNKDTMDSVPFRPFLSGSRAHTIYANLVEDTARKLMKEVLIDDLNPEPHPTIVPINIYTLKDNEHYVIKSIEANYLFRDKISDNLLTDDAWKIIVKTCDAFAKHGIDVNHSPAIAICAVAGELPTNDEEAKTCRNWTASNAYWLAKTYGTAIFNLYNDKDYNKLLEILQMVKDKTLDITKVGEYMSQKSVASGAIDTNPDISGVGEDEIPF